MRMVHAIQENTTEGAQAVKQTGVGGDAKIVYALLTGMVSDKIAYAVRETNTNAWEVAPPARPTELELPTRFNPQFTLRDFGPGLGHRFMMDKYAKIGESTKDNDDQAVGGWGFGSKSPLAYLMRSDGAGSFTVVSRFRGFRRVYVIGVGSTGKIEIQFLGEWPLEDEDRGTGLEVSFPVRPADIDRFHDLAREILWSFEPRPVITPAIDFGTARVLHKGDGWTVYDRNTVPWYGPQVRLGPVMYPINMNLAPSSRGWVQSDDHIVFDAKIGTISVSASREQLQYDDRTEAGLRALFEHYAEDWLAKARAQVDAEPTYFAARARAWQISDSLGKRGWGMVRHIGWRGFDFNDDLFPTGGPAKAACWPDIRRRQGPLDPLVFKPDWSVNPGEVSGRKVVIQHGSNRSLERFTEAGLLDTPCLWVRVKRADLDFALDRMGRPEYIVLDDVKLPKQVYGKREKRPESVKRRKLLSSDFQRAFSELVDLDDELIYVQAEGRGRRREIETWVDNNRRAFGADTAARIVRTARELGLLDSFPDIIALEPGECAPAHWRSLGDHLAELIDAAIDTTQVAPTIPWGDSSFPKLLRDVRDRKISLEVLPQDLRDLLAEMASMLETRTTLVREPNRHDNLAKLNLDLTGTDVKSVAKDPTQPIKDRWAVFEAAYPLLSTILNYTNNRGGYIYSESQYALSSEGHKQLKHYFELCAK